MDHGEEEGDEEAVPITYFLERATLRGWPHVRSALAISYGGSGIMPVATTCRAARRRYNASQPEQGSRPSSKGLRTMTTQHCCVVIVW
jgi:hypothetical protein